MEDLDPFLCMGMMLAFFYIARKTCKSKDFLNSKVSGEDRSKNELKAVQILTPLVYLLLPIVNSAG